VPQCFLIELDRKAGDDTVFLQGIKYCEKVIEKSKNLHYYTKTHRKTPTPCAVS
jgi:hypothetical protein